jgi:hypothetical protein
MSNRFDPLGARLADRHYSRTKPGTPQFTGNGTTIVLMSPVVGSPRALWVSKWQKFVRTTHWIDSWVCSLFRNEGAGISSELIDEAVKATCAVWGAPPARGFVTFVDAAKTARGRSRRNLPGHCYRMAGWEEDGTTDSGLLALRLRPDAFPDPVPPHEYQTTMLLQQRDWSNTLSKRVSPR